VLDDEREGQDIPGAVLAVSTPECGLWVGASGQSTPDDPMRPDHVLRVGSVTKTYLAATLTDLAVAGKLSLDAALSTWLPSFPGADQITVRQILNHSSGIFNYTDSQAFLQAVSADPGEAWTPEELVDLAAQEPPYFAPGEGWKYSNTNYILAGMILESVTGMGVGQVLRERLLTPLSLSSTFLDGEEAITGDLAHGYQGAADVTTLLHPSAAWSAGAVAASAGDVARWAVALYEGNAIAPAALAEMKADPIVAQPGMSYGLGTMFVGEPIVAAPSIGHSGGIPGFGTWMLYQPDSQVAVVSIVNDSGKKALPIAAAALEVALDK
jgi:D-alanyl-D-alanine carboxypeptidase